MNSSATHPLPAAAVRAVLLGSVLFVALPAAAFAGVNSASGDASAPSLENASPAVASKPAKMPSAEQLTMLVHSTLDRVDYGNKTGSYLGLYSLLAPQVQQRVDLQKLTDAMGGFRKLNVDMGPALKAAPQYDQPPQLSPDGLLTLRGAFPTQPRQIRFDLSYVQVDGSWRLQVLNVDTPPSQAAANAAQPKADAPSAPAPTRMAAAAAPVAAPAPAPAAPAPSPPPPAADAGNSQNAPRPSVSINSPFLDTSTDPPTALKW